ncbi:hypothetical protein ACET3Z_010788 [Daucus carota]
MSFNPHTPLNKLNSSKIKWNIRVRIQALWKGITRETKEFRGLNLILIDDSKYRIHAFVNARFSNLFDNDLKEGEIFIISNFIVQEYTGVEFHRCVRNDKHIFFADYTKLKKDSNPGLKIPTCAFDFFELADVEKMYHHKSYLCDVVAVVKEHSELKEYVTDKGEAKKQKSLIISDGSVNIKVAFFDDLAESLQHKLAAIDNNEIVIIIASAKIGIYQGEISMSNFPATRFYVNLDHVAVNKLMKRAKQPDFFKEVIYVYDNICSKCEINMKLEDGRYRCDRCGRHYTWPPRRLLFKVLFILLDREVRRLTGKTVFDVQLDLVEGEEEPKFPPILKSIVNTEYKIKIKITEENINKISEVYEAFDIEIIRDRVKNTKEPVVVEEMSEAEDDLNLTSPPENTSDEIMTPPNPVTQKKGRIRKVPERFDDISETIPPNKIKATAIKKEFKSVARSKTNKNTSVHAAPKKKTINKKIFTQSLMADEDVPLKNYQKKKNKQVVGLKPDHLVTCSISFGHISNFLQTDFWNL